MPWQNGPAVAVNASVDVNCRLSNAFIFSSRQKTSFSTINCGVGTCGMGNSKLFILPSTELNRSTWDIDSQKKASVVIG